MKYKEHERGKRSVPVVLNNIYRVSVMNTAPSCGLPTHCRSGTKFPFARLSEPALPFLVLFGRGTT